MLPVTGDIRRHQTNRAARDQPHLAWLPSRCLLLWPAESAAASLRYVYTKYQVCGLPALGQVSCMGRGFACLRY